MSLSTPQIAAQLERVLESDPAALAVAIRAETRQGWPESVTQMGRRFMLRWCPSTLAVREALCELEQQDLSHHGLIVLTPLRTNEIAEDIAARLARARVFQPEGWDIVRQLFQAKELDARLSAHGWMPQALIDGAASGAYDPVPNGFLDVETAWREILRRLLSLDAARPDAVELLKWSVTQRADSPLRALPSQTRSDVLAWLRRGAGSAGALVVDCIEAGRTADALPIGLVCGVVFSPNAEGVAALGHAAVRLERFVRDQHVGLAEGRAWARAADQVVRSLTRDITHPMMDRAEALLAELRITDYAAHSDLLPLSLNQRLLAFARALADHASDATAAHLSQVEVTADNALSHLEAGHQQSRLERVEMARRLARWISLDVPDLSTMALSAAWQTDQGAFVDWARFRLLGGDDLPELSQAYHACREAVIARRNDAARSFSERLVEGNARVATAGNRVIPLETVLERVLAPIAAKTPVLLLVMDGLSLSIFRELFARMAHLGWSEAVPEGVGRPLVGLAALPTITEVSRASLLCGRLTVGASSQEKTGFASNEALLGTSRTKAPPKLFHKGDLADATNLSEEVRTAIADTQQQVVGLVYNAVDDHLSGPDQLHQRWALEDLRLMLPLLAAARQARRVVVVTADHGHLLEDGTTQIPGGTSDRWRPGAAAQSPQELAVSGGRVRTSDGSNAIVALWGESTRYAGRKNGYHGGLSPQEVLVPLSVLAPSGMTLDGWTAAPPQQPDWWDLSLSGITARPSELASAPPAPSPRGTRQRSAATGQAALFETPAPPVISQEPALDWLSELFGSAVYTSQKQLAARVAPPDDKVRAMLIALTERGGRLSRAALAQRVGMPESRLNGLLSVARRVLNVDQTSVLTVDEGDGSVTLNHALLAQQFHLTQRGGSR
jgi:hypothetical protein